LKKIDPKAKREFFFTEKQGINDIALIMMCKDEEDIIFENLTWHYALGFRKFIVFNNNSKDKTRERLEDFREKTKQDSVVYIIDDPIIDYIQSEKTTAAFKFALQLWSDLKWIFPVDADEFICTTRSLREILSAIPKEADSVVLPKSRYHSQSLVYDNFFESAQYRDELNQGIWDIKVFLRNNPKLIINQGNHSVKSNSLMPLYTSHPDIFMIEFHDRSIPYLKNKIINMGQAFEEKSKTNDFHAKWRLKSYQSYLERGDLYLKEFFNNSHNLHSKFLIHDPFPIQEAIDFAFYKTHNKV
jgi:glycosyltransferase involved in cell wall biosynthesis